VLLSVGRSSTGQEAKEKPRPERALRVLFIGNSLTATNDLPSKFAAMARAGGQTPPFVRSVVAGGFSLEDHWNQGDAPHAIAGSKWDVVVLQQGPSALPESREVLIRDTRRFSELIRESGATPALYMVWPSTQRARDFDRVCESYRLAAKDVDGLILPAGEAWRAAWRVDPKLALYSPDGLHPTTTGTYMTALVMYEQFYDQTPVGLPSRLTVGPRRTVRIDLPAETLKAIQEAASRAVAAEKVKPEPTPAIGR